MISNLYPSIKQLNKSEKICLLQYLVAEIAKDEAINSSLQTPRSPGLLKGKLGEAFFDPLPEEELQLWLSASEVSDKKIWGHPEEEIYNELL